MNLNKDKHNLLNDDFVKISLSLWRWAGIGGTIFDTLCMPTDGGGIPWGNWWGDITSPRVIPELISMKFQTSSLCSPRTERPQTFLDSKYVRPNVRFTPKNCKLSSSKVIWVKHLRLIILVTTG